MNFIQNMMQVVEVGKGQSLVRLIPLTVAILILAVNFDLWKFRGLSDSQSMDNAQLARQIATHQGFTTKFIRPYAITQLQDYKASLTGKKTSLFPPDQFPPGTPRVLPDTYNAPGYPFLLAGWFRLVHPEFTQTGTAIAKARAYSGDRWIPPLNQFFMFLTAIMIFILSCRLFDDRVAWMSLVTFLATDLIWSYSVTALSTTFLMFLITGVFMCALEIFCVGEDCLHREERSFAPAWLWTLALGVLLGLACLTRLNLLVLLVPLFAWLLLIPRASVGLPILIVLVVAGAVTPWFLYMAKVSGNPLGSNMSLLLYGEGSYSGNQIFCASSISSYELLFQEASHKETSGFRWQFEHFWNLLGSSPMILFFGASILHVFKRPRTRFFHWLVFGCALFLIAANNLGFARPETLDPWNILIILFPCMVVLGSAFFFLLLDRLNLPMRLLNTLVVITTLMITALPLALTATTAVSPYSFPPYIPPWINILGQYAQPDEWVTTDMPWATAWYADRPSLWLPDSISDFEAIHNNVCPSGILLLTPVSWMDPLNNFTTGEYKDWYSFATGQPAPANFPLIVPTVTPPNGPDYHLWSDRNRWQAK